MQANYSAEMKTLTSEKGELKVKLEQADADNAELEAQVLTAPHTSYVVSRIICSLMAQTQYLPMVEYNLFLSGCLKFLLRLYMYCFKRSTSSSP